MNLDDYLETIVSEHYEALFRFAMSLTRAESDAWDLTQQTFYVWATKGHQLRELSKVKTWLFTTLYRVFLKTQRRQNRFHHHSLDEVAEQLPALPAELTSEADYAQVLHALAKIDEIFLPSVALFYLEDYSYKEIAAILAVPLGTVKSRIARGIVQLREILLPHTCNSSPDTDGISSIANTDEPAAVSETRFIAPATFKPNPEPQNMVPQWA